MKPRNLNANNWDVNVAVFEMPGFDGRVTADGKRFWFRVSIGLCFADVTLPISDFRKAIDFVSTFDLNTLTDENTIAGKRLGSYGIEIFNRVGAFKNGKIKYTKTPAMVLLMPLRQKIDHSIALRLSLFKKMVRWYNSDI